jgi:hypothetical protein
MYLIFVYPDFEIAWVGTELTLWPDWFDGLVFFHGLGGVEGERESLMWDLGSGAGCIWDGWVDGWMDGG